VKRQLLFILLVLSIIFLGINGYANPNLTTNPQAGVITYALSGSAWVPTSVPAQADGSLLLDVGPSSVGVNTVNISACSSVDSVWGVLCSSAIPFSFTRPSVPGVPSGAKLTP
jgi:hypothetical protein